MDAYERYGRALVRKAERIVRSRADAQDIVQGLFVDMLEKSPPSLDLPYLYRAVTHRCLSYVRDEKNRARLLGENDAVLAGARTRCDERAIDMDLLVKLVNALDEETLEILFFRFFDDMTLEEIAETCDLNRKTVGRKLDAIAEAVRALTAEGVAPS
jgi:RNA polymerase sigma-70 factor (ECF subfamily)